MPQPCGLKGAASAASQTVPPCPADLTESPQEALGLSHPADSGEARSSIARHGPPPRHPACSHASRCRDHFQIDPQGPGIPPPCPQTRADLRPDRRGGTPARPGRPLTGALRLATPAVEERPLWPQPSKPATQRIPPPVSDSINPVHDEGPPRRLKAHPGPGDRSCVLGIISPRERIRVAMAPLLAAAAARLGSTPSRGPLRYREYGILPWRFSAKAPVRT